MALVVFLRGVNVGGQKRFKPSVLARELRDFGVSSLGAAGTFIVRRDTSSKSLRREILRRLPFEAQVMICPADEIVSLVRTEPFGHNPPAKDVKRFVSVMADAPRTVPRLPIERPVGGDWEVRLLRVTGRYALSVWRRRGARVVYPNEVVESSLGVAATTRGWNTLTSISNTLERG